MEYEMCNDIKKAMLKNTKQYVPLGRTTYRLDGSCKIMEYEICNDIKKAMLKNTKQYVPLGRTTYVDIVEMNRRKRRVRFKYT
jgi:hypothetical protein